MVTLYLEFPSPLGRIYCLPFRPEEFPSIKVSWKLLSVIRIRLNGVKTRLDYVLLFYIIYEVPELYLGPKFSYKVKTIEKLLQSSSSI